MTTESILQYQSKADLVIAHLRQAIQSGQVRPGQRLVLDTIAAELGVSKVPVREAITRLTGEGLVELRPHIGPVIPSFTSDDVIETAILRVAVEAVALDIAIPLHDDKSLATSQKLLDSMDDEQEAFPELNVRFHASLVAPIPYRFIHENVEALLRRAQRFATIHRVPGYRTEAQIEHQAILEAARVGDVARVKRLNESHVRSAADQLVARLEA